MKNLSFTKIIIIWVLVFSTIWITASYILAWYGKFEIAEALSENITEVLLGSIITYAVKEGVFNTVAYKTKHRNSKERDM